MDHPALSDLNQSKSLQTVLAISYFYYRESVVSGGTHPTKTYTVFYTQPSEWSKIPAGPNT